MTQESSTIPQLSAANLMFLVCRGHFISAGSRLCRPLYFNLTYYYAYLHPIVQLVCIGFENVFLARQLASGVMY